MPDYIYNPESGELYHYGVKGMKWGVRKRVEEPEKFKASNGMTVARSKNAYVRGLRKVASNRAVNDFAVATYRNSMARNHADTVTNRLETAKGEQRMRKEAQAVREYNAHVKDLKRGTGTKYLDREVRKNKIDDAYEKVKSSSSTVNRMVFNDSVRRQAAKYMVDNNMSMKEATKKANKNAAIQTAAILAVNGAFTVAELYAKK